MRFAEKKNVKKLRDEGPCRRLRDSKRIWSTLNSLGMRSRRDNKSSFKSIGIRVLSIRYVYLFVPPSRYSNEILLQDEEILKRHDFTEATESTVDVTMLPQVMQVRDFGKRSRTKYTHLVDQDTTIGSGGFGGAGTIKVGSRTVEGGQGCFLCGGPHMKKGKITRNRL